MNYLLAFNKSDGILLLNVNMRLMAGSKSDILQGTLDLIVLKTLETLGPRTATALRFAFSRYRRIFCT